MPKLRTLPTFLFIGASKCGSTWLFEMLRAHPGVFVPPAKDLMFFDRNYGRGLDWYASHFRGADGRPCGELTNEYFLEPLFAERIRDSLPDVRLICCLRQPVDRALSRYRYALSTGLPTRTSFVEFCAREDIRHESDYAGNLKPFFEIFGRDRLLVTWYDDLRADPAAYLSRVYDFIGADSRFQPRGFTRRVLPAQAPRFWLLGALAFRTAKLMRRLRLEEMLGHLKASRLMNAIYQPAAAEGVPSPAEMAQAAVLLRSDLTALEALVRSPVPAAWRIGA